ncbi:ubiquitin-like protein ATG12 [Strigops habroptila]|uniref:Ubiquitin-like protein ATG12 n=1 Tax=Strigops habroptila TaxID=2489341 RepID=A0A672V936_STRHB|nr:ubiquitin-like protein ATG12 [Strigops habroptila]
MRMALIMVGRRPPGSPGSLRPCCPCSSSSCPPVTPRSRGGGSRSRCTTSPASVSSGASPRRETPRHATQRRAASPDRKAAARKGQNTLRGHNPRRVASLPVPSMAEAEEQPGPASPQSEDRGEAVDGGAAAGGADAAPPPAGSPGSEETAGDMKKKIDILLKAVGDTPIMKTKKWAVERTRTIQSLVDFIKKFLKLMASEQLFIYVNQSFAPCPDQEVGTLYECFGSDGKLVLHYCKTQAWG